MSLMDKVDRRILQELQANARIANVELAKRVGLSATPCYERVRKLERQGVITGYHAAVSYDDVGFEARAFILLKLNLNGPDAYSDFSTVINEMPEIEECFFVAGKNDCIVKVACTGTKELRDFYISRLVTLPWVNDAESFFIIDTVKEISGRQVTFENPED